MQEAVIKATSLTDCPISPSTIIMPEPESGHFIESTATHRYLDRSLICLHTSKPQDYHGKAFLSLATSYLSARTRARPGAWWSSPRPEARREPAQESEGEERDEEG